MEQIWSFTIKQVPISSAAISTQSFLVQKSLSSTIRIYVVGAQTYQNPFGVHLYSVTIETDADSSAMCMIL